MTHVLHSLLNQKQLNHSFTNSNTLLACHFDRFIWRGQHLVDFYLCKNRRLPHSKSRVSRRH